MLGVVIRLCPYMTGLVVKLLHSDRFAVTKLPLVMVGASVEVCV